MVGYIRQAWLVLVLGLTFGLALAGVNHKLAPIIRANETAARQKAAKEFFAVGEVDPNTLTAEARRIVLSAGEDKAGETAVMAYGVRDSRGRLLGWAAPAQGAGYADTIKLMVGLSADAASIQGIKVIYNQETPGLGNKIVGEEFLGQFKTKPVAAHLRPSKQSSGLADDEIQAITGATISSRAVCDILHSQLTDSGLAAKLAELADGKGAANPDAQ